MPPKQKKREERLGEDKNAPADLVHPSRPDIFRAELEIVPEMLGQLLRHYNVVRDSPIASSRVPEMAARVDNEEVHMPLRMLPPAPLVTELQHASILRTVKAALVNKMQDKKIMLREMGQITETLWNCIVPTLLLIEKIREAATSRAIAYFCTKPLLDSPGWYERNSKIVRENGITEASLVKELVPSRVVRDGVSAVIHAVMYAIAPSKGRTYVLTAETRNLILNGYRNHEGQKMEWVNDPAVFLSTLDDLQEYMEIAKRPPRSMYGHMYTQDDFRITDTPIATNSRGDGWFLAVIRRANWDVQCILEAHKAGDSTGSFKRHYFQSLDDRGREMTTEDQTQRLLFAGAIKVNKHQEEGTRHQLDSKMVYFLQTDVEGWYLPFGGNEVVKDWSQWKDGVSLPCCTAMIFYYLALRSCGLIKQAIEILDDPQLTVPDVIEDNLQNLQKFNGKQFVAKTVEKEMIEEEEAIASIQMYSRTVVKEGTGIRSLMGAAVAVCFPPKLWEPAVQSYEHALRSEDTRNTYIVRGVSTAFRLSKAEAANNPPKLMTKQSRSGEETPVRAHDIISALYSSGCRNLPFVGKTVSKDDLQDSLPLIGMYPDDVTQRYMYCPESVHVRHWRTTPLTDGKASWQKFMREERYPRQKRSVPAGWGWMIQQVENAVAPLQPAAVLNALESAPPSLPLPLPLPPLLPPSRSLQAAPAGESQESEGGDVPRSKKVRLKVFSQAGNADVVSVSREEEQSLANAIRLQDRILGKFSSRSSVESVPDTTVSFETVTEPIQKKARTEMRVMFAPPPSFSDTQSEANSNETMRNATNDEECVMNRLEDDASSNSCASTNAETVQSNDAQVWHASRSLQNELDALAGVSETSSDMSTEDNDSNDTSESDDNEMTLTPLRNENDEKLFVLTKLAEENDDSGEDDQSEVDTNNEESNEENEEMDFGTNASTVDMGEF